MDGEEIIGGLTAPRHPRWWRDTLLVAEGGSGRLLAVDPARHTAETVTEVPGVAGGLAVHGSHAVLGCSAAGAAAQPVSRAAAFQSLQHHGTGSAWWTSNAARSSERPGSPVTPGR